jgi:hypothetical protein
MALGPEGKGTSLQQIMKPADWKVDHEEQVEI